MFKDKIVTIEHGRFSYDLLIMLYILCKLCTLKQVICKHALRVCKFVSKMACSVKPYLVHQVRCVDYGLFLKINRTYRPRSTRGLQLVYCLRDPTTNNGEIK